MPHTLSRVIVAACLTIACSHGAHAQIRTSPTPGQAPAPRILYPQSEFDQAAALRALDKGTATIKGAACARKRAELYFASNRQVLLLPATAYLDEVLRLQKAATTQETVVPSELLMQTSVSTMTDDKGRFQFTEMKPGRYYLFMAFDFNTIQSRNVYAGSSYGYGASVDHYERRDYTVSHQDVLETFVEIKQEGQTARASLVSKGALGKLLRCVPI